MFLQSLLLMAPGIRHHCRGQTPERYRSGGRGSGRGAAYQNSQNPCRTETTTAWQHCEKFTTGHGMPEASGFSMSTGKRSGRCLQTRSTCAGTQRHCSTRSIQTNQEASRRSFKQTNISKASRRATWLVGGWHGVPEGFKVSNCAERKPGAESAPGLTRSPCRGCGAGAPRNSSPGQLPASPLLCFRGEAFVACDGL